MSTCFFLNLSKKEYKQYNSWQSLYSYKAHKFSQISTSIQKYFNIQLDTSKMNRMPSSSSRWALLAAEKKNMALHFQGKLTFFFSNCMA